MAKRLTLEERIEGCLVGAAIGAELGFARCVEQKRFRVDLPEKMFKVTLSPVKSYMPEKSRVWAASAWPMVDVGVRAYLKARGRATAEDFAQIFAEDKGVATPAFQWDGLHTVQEMLKEGMPARIGGMLVTPCGLVCAAMPAVGAYHFGHPEYAYQDGVELASVQQARVGADWAGLCAAAIAAAFEERANGQTIYETVLKVAFQNARKMYYELDHLDLSWKVETEKAFLKRWHVMPGQPGPVLEAIWGPWNPLPMVLPVVKRFGRDPRKVMALLLATPSSEVATAPHVDQSACVSAVIAGAILGAMHGAGGFPKAWRSWGEKKAAPWQKLTGVVKKRVRTEASIIKVTEQLAREDGPGGESLLKDKIVGCILAGAIGNAMGSPVEGRVYKAIDKEYPKGIRTILDPTRLESEDDNQMAMLLVETYIGREGEPATARDFGKTWLDRLNGRNFFTGCMRHTYDLLREGWDPRIIGHWSQVTGSTVMCFEPVGIYHMGDREFAEKDALSLSYMYQRGLDAVAAAMLAATVAEAFRPEATVESICEAALQAAPTTTLKTFDKRPFKSARHYLETCLKVARKYDDVMKARRELYEKCLLYHLIDPLEVWGLALAMFTVADGYVREAAIGGTNIGRDSDTIAGRAAMLAGILRGAKGVPGEWVKMFGTTSIQRIHGNADRLCELIVKKKMPMMEKRQAIARAAV